MSLVQTLVSRSEEREPIEIVLVVHFDAFGETGGRIAGDDQANQQAVHVHLIAIWRRPATKTAAVRKTRIDSRVERNDVARGAVDNWNGPTQIDRIDDVQPWTFERGHR